MEQKRDRIVAEIQAERKKRCLARITEHTTSEADRVIGEVPHVVQKCIAEELDKRLGPGPQGTIQEALEERARAKQEDLRAAELREEGRCFARSRCRRARG